MKYYLNFIAVIIVLGTQFSCEIVFGQSNVQSLNFEPLTANPFEPRMGFFFYTNRGNLRLDIGSAYDLKKWNTENGLFAAGVEMFTLTQLRSAGRMKFPVETTDFYFGVNATFNSGEFALAESSKANQSSTSKSDNIFRNFSARLRLAHISSHLVDGKADGNVFTQSPFVYSREFAELIAAYHIRSSRIYGGFTYVFSTLPAEVHKIIPQLGVDAELSLYSGISLKAAVDFKIDGYDGKTETCHSTTAGILFQTSEHTGLFISLNNYEGKNFHGMFYKEKMSDRSIGIQVYFK